MLAKDKKPDAKKEEAKERAQVIPPRAETPKLLKAAIEMTEKSGLRGALSKLKDKTNKSNVSLQVPFWLLYIHIIYLALLCTNFSFTLQPSLASTLLTPSPSPGQPVEQELDILSQNSESSTLARLTMACGRDSAISSKEREVLTETTEGGEKQDKG